MEFEELGMIVNFGARMELWQPNMQYFQDVARPISSPLVNTESKIRFSPRFGISYPISDKAAFHLAYGHFYQYVRYMELMSGINDRGFYGGRPNLGDPGPGISNANANPEKTITYETGVQIQLSQNWTLNLTAYYREMSDLIGVRFIQAVPENYFYLDNVDFGNAKGVEAILEKRMAENWSLVLNYTWSLAEISTSSPLTAQQQTQDVPFQTFRADWDIPHSFGALATYQAPSNITVSFRGVARSGRPYTVLAEALNTERMTWDIQSDLRIAKKFKFDAVSPVVYLQVFNLLDRRNIRRVYELTGKWDDDGESATPRLVDAVPTRISDGRSLRLGVRMEF
jgi:outer membrane receptor protein involved in Fe transport